MSKEITVATRKPIKLKPMPRPASESLGPRPLIFESQHKNIVTLMGFLAAILVGLGSGWFVGDSLTSDFNPSLSQQNALASSVTIPYANDSSTPLPSAYTAREVPEDSSGQLAEPSNTTSADRKDGEAEQQAKVALQADDADRRPVSSRRAAFNRSSGDPVPVSILKGKPIKSAFGQLKKVKFW